MGKYKFGLVSCVRDEGPYIAEWVAHHRALGFEHIFIYENDSFDNTVRTLKMLTRMGAIKYFSNASADGKGMLNRALRRVSRLPIYQELDWLLHIDTDEFFCINTEEGTLDSLVEKLDDDIGTICFDRLSFGTEGRVNFLRGFVVEQSRKCNDPTTTLRQAILHKSMFRPQHFLRPGIHYPKVELIENSERVNGSGVRYGELAYNPLIFSDRENAKLGMVNHYALRDLKNFMLKIKRGSARNPNRIVGESYFVLNNRDDYCDERILRFLPAMKREYKRLNKLSNGRLDKLRRRAFIYRKRRFAELMKDPEMLETFEAYKSRFFEKQIKQNSA